MLVLVGQSTVEPVSVAELRTYLRMESTDSTAEDLLLASYITAARRLAENITKRALVPSTWQVVTDSFCHATATIELPRPPLSTVSTSVIISYVQDTTAGASITVGSTVYTVDLNSEPGRVYPSYGNEWPVNSVREQKNAVTVQYASGYSTVTGNIIPDSMKIWIQQRAAGMFENREPLITGMTIAELPRDYMMGLLDPYKVISITS